MCACLSRSGLSRAWKRAPAKGVKRWCGGRKGNERKQRGCSRCRLYQHGRSGGDETGRERARRKRGGHGAMAVISTHAAAGGWPLGARRQGQTAIVSANPGRCVGAADWWAAPARAGGALISPHYTNTTFHILPRLRSSEGERRRRSGALLSRQIWPEDGGDSRWTGHWTLDALQGAVALHTSLSCA